MTQGVGDLLRSRRTEDRIRAVRSLADDPGVGGVALLLQALDDRSPYVAGLAAQALADRADWDSCGDLLAAFERAMADGPKRDPGCMVRARLASALGRLGYHFAVDALRAGIRHVQMEQMTDTAVPLRANCALALAEMGASDALRDIALLLFDTSGDVAGTSAARCAAARALSRLGDPAAATVLALKLQTGSGDVPEVLMECMQALVLVQDPRAAEALVPRLDDPNPGLAAYAALALADTRLPEAAGAISERVGRFEGELLDTVMLALARCGSDEGMAALKRFAAMGPRPVQRAARLALETAGGPRESDEDAASGAATEP